MPLRTPNNPNTDKKVLQVLANLLPNDPVTGLPNTQIGLNQLALSTPDKQVSLCYVENKYTMAQGPFPAVHLSSGNQHYNKNSNKTYMGLFVAIIEYYDRWDKQSYTIDAVRANIAADLERMKANIEGNDALAYQGQNYAISTPQIQLSPYKGSIDDQFPGLVLIRRTLTLNINILPYDAL